MAKKYSSPVIRRLAYAAALSLPAFSNALAEPFTFYGKLNVSYQYADEGEGSFSDLKSNSSRLGVKGELALQDNLTAFYLLEWQVDLADLSGDDNIKSRNQYVGLRGNWGEVSLGRQDTALKMAQGKLDQFNDLEGDIKNLWRGENRPSDTITYRSPKWQDLQFTGTFIAGEKDGPSTYSASITYGDAGLKSLPWYLVVANDSNVSGYDIQRLGGQYKLDDWVIGAMAQRQERESDGDSRNGWLLSSAYTLQQLALKLQYQELEQDWSMSAGIDYPLAKQVKLYAFVTRQDKQELPDKDWLGLGLEFRF
ncbi:porin [Bowmanella sp. Y26]|uniref:porin n=1 Tax=Bowmanella yangjiangensis TaxID=2811230 RepID=UPI001BDD2D26|nr:porin [Bowmanella yangjiangensis]MBT1062737.1 porin [Bowmanella yangjiangensis]